FGELFSFQDDPNTKIGRSRAGDLTIQREIPGNMIVEIGWTGRWSDRLPQGVNFNSAPYFFVDTASKQTFAQAYDAVAAALADVHRQVELQRVNRDPAEADILRVNVRCNLHFL